MQRCITCQAVYDDNQQYCEMDGTPLLSTTNLIPRQQPQKLKEFITKRGTAIAAAAALIAASAFGGVYFFNRRPAPPVAEEAPAPAPEVGADTRQPPTDPPRQPPEVRPGYFVIGLSAPEQADAVREMERLNQQGYRTHVAYSSEWSGLAPGLYLMVYGVFDTMAEAAAAADELKSRDIQVYVKYSGAPKAGGAVPTTAQEAGRRGAEPDNEISPARTAAVGQYGAAGEEAVNEVIKLWEQHFTKCGDSYVSLGLGNRLRQLKGVSFVVSRRNPLTKGDELKGFEWGGQVKAKWNVWRRAVKRDSGWAWEEWRDSPQSYTFDVSKNNSRWRVLNAVYDQQKVECPDRALF